MRHPGNWGVWRSRTQSGVAEDERPCIYVVAGTNGAGKSSVVGAAIIECGLSISNPDEIARGLRVANASLSQADANIEAWSQGTARLREAIGSRLTYAFETTLGGTTIAALLGQALAAGIDVRMWYVGLATADLHISRVKARVARGGHDIPSDKIRERHS